MLSVSENVFLEWLAPNPALLNLMEQNQNWIVALDDHSDDIVNDLPGLTPEAEESMSSKEYESAKRDIGTTINELREKISEGIDLVEVCFDHELEASLEKASRFLGEDDSAWGNLVREWWSEGSNWWSQINKNRRIPSARDLFWVRNQKRHFFETCMKHWASEVAWPRLPDADWGLQWRAASKLANERLSESPVAPALLRCLDDLLERLDEPKFSSCGRDDTETDWRSFRPDPDRASSFDRARLLLFGSLSKCKPGSVLELWAQDKEFSFPGLQALDWSLLVHRWKKSLNGTATPATFQNSLPLSEEAWHEALRTWENSATNTEKEEGWTPPVVLKYLEEKAPELKPWLESQMRCAAAQSPSSRPSRRTPRV